MRRVCEFDFDIIGERNDFRVLDVIEYSRSCRTMVSSLNGNPVMRRLVERVVSDIANSSSRTANNRTCWSVGLCVDVLAGDLVGAHRNCAAQRMQADVDGRR